MINGLQGIPGSGKSYEASVFQVLEALKQGRKVITNLPLVLSSYTAIEPAYADLIELRWAPGLVRGRWDAESVDPATGQGQAFRLFEDGHTEAPGEGARIFGTVWCYWSDWKHPKTGHGPLFVVDECHVAMPKIGVDQWVVQWYKLHRHFNCDVLLATQNFRQMSQDIAELMAMVIKVRKADILGRSDEYIRKVHAGYRGAVIQESVRKYEPHFFGLYRSHTQGSSVLEASATDVAPLSVKLKRWTRVSWVLSLVMVLFAWWVIAKPGAKKSPEPKVHQEAGGWIGADGKTDLGAMKRDLASQGALPPVAAENAPSAAPVALPEPYAGKGLHVTGRIAMGKRVLFTFAVSSSSTRIADVSSEDLIQAGYKWEALTDCAGYLRWGKDVRAVTCDAPRAIAGTSEKPLVLNEGYGSDGRTPAGKGGGTHNGGLTSGPGLVQM